MQILRCLQLAIFLPIVFAKISTFKHPFKTGKSLSSLVSEENSRVRQMFPNEERVGLSEVSPKLNPGYIRSLVAGYNQQLERNPYITKMITSSIVGGLGDVLVQLLSQADSIRELDYRRTSVMMLVGGLYVAPLMHNWFYLLSKIPLPNRLAPFGKALVMMLVDQTVGAPMVISGFFMAHEIASRLLPPYHDPPSMLLTNAVTAGVEAVRNKFWLSMVANWYCWPVVNLINFYAVPLPLRVLFANLAAVFWNMFLSRVANA